MGDRASDNEDVRNDFLEALLKLFQENPGAEASVTALCAKAGYSRSTFYRYFDSLPEAYETLEDRVVPTGVLQALVAGGDTVCMEDITGAFLGTLTASKRELTTLFARDVHERFFNKLKATMKPVFRLQAERAFSMTPFEYDVMAEYLTTAKLSLLRMWALSPIDLDLAYMTKVTDATLEGGLWDRIDEATREIRRGKNPLGRTIPIIAMTTNAFSPDKQACFDAGTNAHVVPTKQAPPPRNQPATNLQPAKTRCSMPAMRIRRKPNAPSSHLEIKNRSCM
ncbi:TetR family transcriptional regulator [Senegalimassilia sp.]